MVDPSLFLGVPEIDEHHEAIFLMLHELVAASKRGTAVARAAELFSALETRTAKHFDAEEHLMINTGYPHLDEHRASHQLFFSDVLPPLRATFDRAGTMFTLTRMLDRAIRHWIRNHINDADRQFVDWLNNSEGGGARAARSP